MTEQIANRKEQLYWDMFRQIYDDVNTFGQNELGGMDRLAFTEADNKAHSYLKGLAEEVGFQTKTDGAGNLWITAKGSEDGNPDYPVMYVGSHMDTVPDGGRYDGTLGVLAAFHAMLLLQQYAPKRTVTLLVLRCEESSRFSCATVGSKLLAGKLSPEQLKQYRDKDGVVLYNAIVKAGGNPESLQQEREVLQKGFGFAELHIEQGPVLEKSNTSIGIVEAIAAPYRMQVTVTGNAAHSGACPMDARQDALAGAAEMILAVEALGQEYSNRHMVATVGNCEVNGGAINVVAGSVSFPVDIRGVDGMLLKQAAADCTGRLRKIAERRGLVVEFRLLGAEEPVILSGKIGNIMETTCGRIGMRCCRMNSGAGQDTMYMAELMDAGICFVPCVNGISHNRAEAVTDTTMLDSVEFLTELLRDICCAC